MQDSEMLPNSFSPTHDAIHNFLDLQSLDASPGPFDLLGEFSSGSGGGGAGGAAGGVSELSPFASHSPAEHHSNSTGSGSGFSVDDYMSKNDSHSPEALVLGGAYEFIDAAAGMPVYDRLGHPANGRIGMEVVGEGEARIGATGAVGGGEKANQLALAISSMDPATQSQLLAALLSSQQPPSTSTTAMAPNSLSPSQQRRRHSPLAVVSGEQSYPSGTRSHPQSRSVSAHNSPRPFQPQYIPALPSSQSQHLYQNPYQLAIATALPPSIQPSPMSSPFNPNIPQQYFPSQQPSSSFVPVLMGQHQQPHPGQFQNAFSARSFPNPLQQEHNTDFPHHSSIAEGASSNMMEMTDSEMETLRGASATGDRYATTVDSEEWRENDFMFSPLMSPALTAHSNFSQASSLPPSASCLPTPLLHGNLVSPAEIFSPLGSPAIMPHVYHTDPGHLHNVNWQNPHVLQGLQGLVDQTKALAFESSSVHASPTGFHLSPRIVPTGSIDATATGSGRRGASSKKSRPSPLLKPTPDATLRRKKVAGMGENKSKSIGSRSTTTSPFLGPSHHSSAMISGQSKSSNSLTSPPDVDSNTPSPVDLAMSSYQSSYPSQDQGEMGPPPLPSSSRRTSLNNSSIPASGDWMNLPVTPATFMTTFPADGLSVGSVPSMSPHTGSYSFQEDLIIDDGHRITPTASTSSSTGALTPRLPTASASASVKKVVTKRLAKIAAAPEVSSSSSNAIFSITSVTESASSSAVIASKLKGKAIGNTAAAGVKKKPAKAKKNQGSGSDTGAGGNYGTGVDSGKKASHKVAEQKRRDSLKIGFEELRTILPPIAHYDEERRPGEGNVGGGSVDPIHPNRGVSKIALLRRSNEYIGILHERISRRDLAIMALRYELDRLRGQVGEEGGDAIEEYDLDHLDADEKKAGTTAYYENYGEGSDDEIPAALRVKPASLKKVGKKAMMNADDDFTPKGTSRRSTRKSKTITEADESMEVEGDDVL